MASGLSSSYSGLYNIICGEAATVNTNTTNVTCMDNPTNALNWCSTQATLNQCNLTNNPTFALDECAGTCHEQYPQFQYNCTSATEATCSGGKWTSTPHVFLNNTDTDVDVTFFMQANSSGTRAFAAAQPDWTQKEDNILSPAAIISTYAVTMQAGDSIAVGPLDCSAPPAPPPLCSTCVVGASQTALHVYFEVCAPCTAQPTFAYAPPNSAAYDTTSFSASCLDGKWTSSQWTSGNGDWTQKLAMNIPALASDTFPLGNMWIRDDSGYGSYIITDEVTALANGELDCAAMPNQNPTLTASAATVTSSPQTTTASGNNTTTASTSTTSTTSATSTSYVIECDCWDEEQASGPTCSERNVLDTCNDNGILLPFGGSNECTCPDRQVGIGSQCDTVVNSECKS